MKLSVVTSTYQLLDLIHWNVHLSRVRNKPAYPVETIIIDGGSDQYIRDGLQRLETVGIADIKVIILEGNKHAAYAMNRAMQEARGDWLLKLDSDVFVTKDVFWQHLSKAIAKYPNSLIGCFKSNVWSREQGYLLGGSCLAWRRGVDLRWDERYIGYGPSDMDFNLQFLEAGYPLRLIPNIGISHLGGIMTGLFYAKQKQQFEEEIAANRRIFFEKWRDKLPTMRGFL